MIDSHCHFDFEEFDENRKSLWQQANAQGIKKLIIPGIAPAQWPKAQQISAELSGIYHACGLHPWYITPDTDNHIFKQTLSQTIEKSAPIAIGECGLDKNSKTPFALQEAVFIEHLQLACDVSLPLILHNVGLHNEMLVLLKRFKPSKGGVIHGFSGSFELAQQYWRLGFSLGIGGVITYARAKKTRECVKAMPLDALLLETDAPDMPPEGINKGQNSPLYLPQIAQTLAKLRQQSLAEICLQTDINCSQRFDIHV